MPINGINLNTNMARAVQSIAQPTQSSAPQGAFTITPSGETGASQAPLGPAGVSSSRLDSPGQSTPGIGEQIKGALDHVNQLQNTANDLSERVVSGNPEDVHKAMVAMEHALMSLDFTLQVRNKVLDAYQQIMQTQV